MFAAGVISVRGGCNKCSRGNTWNKQPRTDQSDYSISLKYGISVLSLPVPRLDAHYTYRHNVQVY